MKQGLIMVVELVSCLMPEDPAPTDGLVVTILAFYERGFGVPFHYLLHSLLWYYVLELHI
jgi:hypothetical protein